MHLLLAKASVIMNGIEMLQHLYSLSKNMLELFHWGGYISRKAKCLIHLECFMDIDLSRAQFCLEELEWLCHNGRKEDLVLL